MTISTDKVLDQILDDLIHMDVVPGIEKARFRDIDDPCVSGHLLELLRKTTEHYREYREQSKDEYCQSSEYDELQRYVVQLEKRQIADEAEANRKIKRLEDILASLRKTIEDERTDPDK